MQTRLVFACLAGGLDEERQSEKERRRNANANLTAILLPLFLLRFHFLMHISTSSNPYLILFPFYLQGLHIHFVQLVSISDQNRLPSSSATALQPLPSSCQT